MNRSQKQKALECATQAALAAGELMRKNFRATKKINSQTQHDIKLELDVRCQERIEKLLRRSFPTVAILGEEGVSGDPQAQYRWVIDPIDGTVNFTYGIPHACTSIALQARMAEPEKRPRSPQPTAEPAYETVAGVVYDPFCDELWTGLRGQPARLNNRIIKVSQRQKLEESVIAIGFAKYDFTVEKMLPVFTRLIRRVRKIRLMGAAALSMVYVASGRMDAYVEHYIRLWDIAAGGLILECAGGDFYHQRVPGEHTYQILVSNGPLRKPLQRLVKMG